MENDAHEKTAIEFSTVQIMKKIFSLSDIPSLTGNLTQDLNPVVAQDR